MLAKSVAASDLGLSGRRTLALAGVVPQAPRVAIVGSRGAHRHFRALVPALVRGAVAEGWSIVSGGAIGIDGDVHRTACEQGVSQLAVLPCGPDRVYPPAHHGLFTRMTQTGESGVLFAHPRGTPPTRAMFASRNALVVQLSAAVIVVEAQTPSGTLITAELARRRRVPVSAVIGSPGAALLVAGGARALDAVDAEASVRQWLRAIAEGGQGPAAAVQWPVRLRALAHRFVAAGARGVFVDELARVPGALGEVLEAEGLGLVIEVSAGRYLPVQPPAVAPLQAAEDQAD